MLRPGHVLRVPVTQDGQDEVLKVVLDQVVPGKGGTQCHLSGEYGGFWIAASVLQWAIAQAEISIDPGHAANPLN
jgi:hypothetical protein